MKCFSPAISYQTTSNQTTSNQTMSNQTMSNQMWPSSMNTNGIPLLAAFVQLSSTSKQDAFVEYATKMRAFLQGKSIIRVSDIENVTRLFEKHLPKRTEIIEVQYEFEKYLPKPKKTSNINYVEVEFQMSKGDGKKKQLNRVNSVKKEKIKKEKEISAPRSKNRTRTSGKKYF